MGAPASAAPFSFLHTTVALKTHWRGRCCNTILAWGVRPTLESLGAYLFAGAFRYLASASVGALSFMTLPASYSVQHTVVLVVQVPDGLMVSSRKPSLLDDRSPGATPCR